MFESFASKENDDKHLQKLSFSFHYLWFKYRNRFVARTCWVMLAHADINSIRDKCGKGEPYFKVNLWIEEQILSFVKRGVRLGDCKSQYHDNRIYHIFMYILCVYCFVANLRRSYGCWLSLFSRSLRNAVVSSSEKSWAHLVLILLGPHTGCFLAFYRILECWLHHSGLCAPS